MSCLSLGIYFNLNSSAYAEDAIKDETKLGCVLPVLLAIHAPPQSGILSKWLYISVAIVLCDKLFRNILSCLNQELTYSSIVGDFYFSFSGILSFGVDWKL